MAISPPDSSTPKFRSSAEKLAQETERDAQKRIRAAQENARELERQYAQESERVKDEYVRQSEDQRARNEGSIHSERQKAYEAMRKIKIAQEAELRRMRAEGDKDKKTLEDHYRGSIYESSKRGEEQLDHIRLKTSEFQNHEQEKARQELEFLQSEHSRRMEHLKEHQDQAFEVTAEQHRDVYEKQSENAKLARDQTEQKFQERFEKLVTDQNETLGRIQGEASERIGKIRQDTAHKLDAYATRQKDPFYKLVDVSAKFADNGDEYVLTATIPKHEQKHVQVTIRGNQLVLSGSRRSEEKIENAPGQTSRTASFQTYSETFPMNWPVEGRSLSREFDGDRLTVRVPKKDMNRVGPQPHDARAAKAKYRPGPEPVRAESPKFPENLPHTDLSKSDSVDGSRPPEDGISRKSRGSGTLA